MVSKLEFLAEAHNVVVTPDIAAPPKVGERVEDSLTNAVARRVGEKTSIAIDCIYKVLKARRAVEVQSSPQDFTAKEVCLMCAAVEARHGAVRRVAATRLEHLPHELDAVSYWLQVKLVSVEL